MDDSSNAIFANICIGALTGNSPSSYSPSFTDYLQSTDFCIDIACATSPSIYTIKGIKVAVIPVDSFVFQSEEKLSRLLRSQSVKGSDVSICLIDWNNTQPDSTTTDFLTLIADAGINVIIGYNTPAFVSYRYIENYSEEYTHCIPSIGPLKDDSSTNTAKAKLCVNLRLCLFDRNVYTQLSIMPTITRFINNTILIDTIYPISDTQKENLYRHITETYPERLLSIPKERKVFLHGSRLLEEIALRTDLTSDPYGIRKSPFDITFSRENTSDSHTINPDIYDLYFFDLTKLTVDNNWPETLERYVTLLNQNFAPDQLVLLRIKLPAIAVKQDQLRFHGDSHNTNSLLETMENYVISALHPTVIDVSEYYFRDQLGGFTIAFESFFYDHCARILEKIASGISSSQLYSEQDYSILFDRVIKYYDNMIARSYQRYFFNTVDAADMIARNSTADFIKKHKDELVFLKSIHAQLDYLPDYYSHVNSCKDLVRAAIAIKLISNGNISESITNYSVIFEYGFVITKVYAKLLSEKIGRTVSYKNAYEISLIQEDKNALEQYYEAHPITEIDVWGSCISRTLVDNAPEYLHVANYIFKQSQPLFDRLPISTIELPADNSAYLNNAWRKRTICSSVQRDGKSVISKSRSSWIVVDLFDLVCRSCLVDGELLEVDDFIKKTQFYKAFSSRSKATYLFRELSQEQISAGLIRFADFISQKYGKNIILVIADLKDTYIDLDGSIKEFSDSDNSFNEKVNCIRYAEKLFIDKTGCYVIDVSKKYQASDRFPLGGALNVHYEAEFYQEACAQIVSIIQKHTQKV